MTKSPLVAGGCDALGRVRGVRDAGFPVAVTAGDAQLARKLEARSPVPAARLRALRKLVDAGVNAGLIIAPVLPGITDDLPHLDILFAAAKRAGARFIHAGPLRLYPAIRDRFLPVLGEHFP